MPFFDADDAAIFYDECGDGAPLVLLHGYALNSLMWEFQTPVFSKSHRVIRVDLRGFGKSSCAKDWSGTVMANDIKGLLSSLNLNNVTILGFSMSGPVAIRVALEMPKVITGLILVSSILPSNGRPKTKSEEALQQREIDILKEQDIRGWAESIGLIDGPFVANMFRRNPQSESLWQTMIERHDTHRILCMLNARLKTESPVDWRSRLPDISQPTLVVAGERDTRFLDASRHLARDIPNSRLEIISGAGHMVNLEEPERFNEVVTGFLR